MTSRANVFTIPAGQPFLDCLATAILAGDLPKAGGAPRSGMELPDITLLLPTRRATRALQEAFLRAAGGRALLLPKIMTVSEGEEDRADLRPRRHRGHGRSHLGHRASHEQSRTSPSIDQPHLALVAGDARRLGRRCAVTGSSTPAQAAALAAELASLMDMIETEDKSLEGLAGLVLEKFSAHWQLTIDFLKIITEYWPAYLAERGLMSAAGRRNAVIHAEARRLAASPPKGPVIIAGVSGSIPATVELMRTVMGLPQGAIVLPALDLALDDASWDTIKPTGADATAHPENPQFGMKTLLDGLGLLRADVTVLKGAEQAPDQAARSVFVSEAMRPAGTTARWQAFAAAARAARLGRPRD